LNSPAASSLRKKGEEIMLTSAVVAIALGIAPVYLDGTVAPSKDGYSSQVGSFRERVDSRGTRHVTGHDARGLPYQLVMSPDGFVEASTGETVVTFQVRTLS
jgi:hypothetical protein